MPIYEYRCEKGHTFDVMQSMSDDPVASCEVCGAPVQKVLHAPAVHFKGSGFYSTDYGKKGAAAGGDSKKDKADSNGSSSGSDSGSGSGSDSSSSDKKSDSKSKPESKSKSGSSSKSD